MLAEKSLALPVSLTRARLAFDYHRDTIVHVAETMVPLRLLIVDELASLPECVAGLTERLGLQTKFRLGDGADDQTSIRHDPAEDTPHVNAAEARAAPVARQRPDGLTVVPRAGGRHRGPAVPALAAQEPAALASAEQASVEPLRDRLGLGRKLCPRWLNWLIH